MKTQITISHCGVYHVWTGEHYKSFRTKEGAINFFIKYNNSLNIKRYIYDCRKRCP